MMEPSSLEVPYMRLSFIALVLAAAAVAAVQAQQVTKEAVPGITNFARIQTTVACAGAVEASAVPDIKKLGFSSIINLRQASEQGANVEGEGAAAKAVGLNYFNILLYPMGPGRAQVH